MKVEGKKCPRCRSEMTVPDECAKHLNYEMALCERCVAMALCRAAVLCSNVDAQRPFSSVHLGHVRRMKHHTWRAQVHVTQNLRRKNNTDATMEAA